MASFTEKLKQLLQGGGYRSPDILSDKTKALARKAQFGKIDAPRLQQNVQQSPLTQDYITPKQDTQFTRFADFLKRNADPNQTLTTLVASEPGQRAVQQLAGFSRGATTLARIIPQINELSKKAEAVTPAPQGFMQKLARLQGTATGVAPQILGLGASPLTMVTSGLLGTGLNTAAEAVPGAINVLQGKRAGTDLKKIGEAAYSGGVKGVEQAPTYALTNFVTNGLSGKLPGLAGLTEKSISQSAPIDAIVKRVVKAAALETPWETLFYGIRDRQDGESLKQSFQREFEQNLKFNLAFAGINSYGDLRKVDRAELDRFVNKSIIETDTYKNTIGNEGGFIGEKELPKVQDIIQQQKNGEITYREMLDKIKAIAPNYKVEDIEEINRGLKQGERVIDDVSFLAQKHPELGLDKKTVDITKQTATDARSPMIRELELIANDRPESGFTKEQVDRIQTIYKSLPDNQKGQAEAFFDFMGVPRPTDTAKGNLEPLLQEARNYDSAENVRVVPDTLNIESLRGDKKGLMQLKAEGYTKIRNNNGEIDLSNIVPDKNAISLVAEANDKNILTDLNPTGTVLTKYNPKSRASMKLGKNITTLDKTSNSAPDELVTIYRGAPKNQKAIVPGDFVTTDYELAKSYTGDGNVISKEVRMKDVLDDVTEPLGGEYIYRPADIYNQAKGGMVNNQKGAIDLTAEVGGKKVAEIDQPEVLSVKSRIAKTSDITYPTKGRFEEFYTNYVNRFYPVEKLEHFVEGKTASKIIPKNSPTYTTKRLLGAGGVAELRHKQKFTPILNEIDNKGIAYDDMDAYLVSRRVVDSLDERGIESGITVEQAQKTISALEQKYGNLNDIAQKLYTYQDEGLQMLRDAGFIDQQGYETIKDLNKSRVPFQRVMDNVNNYLGLPTKKLQQPTQPIKGIKGSEKQILSPLESIMAETYSIEAAVSKNRVAQSIVNLKQLLPDLSIERVDTSGNNTISVWTNGQKELFEVPEDVARAVKGLNEESMSTLTKILSIPASVLRQGATGRNIDFMIPNVFKDQFDAAVNSKYGYVPFVDYARGLGHIVNYKYGDGDKLVEDWINSGGSIFFENMSGRKAISEQLQENSLKPRTSVRVVNKVSDLLDAIGDLSEKPTRVGLFKRALEATNNKELSAIESRDATLDFARMGAKMKDANSIIPFLNVGIQGVDKLLRTVKDNPSKTALLGLIYGVLPQVALSTYNNVFDGDGYSRVPDWEKEGNFILMVGREEDGRPKYIKMPKGNVVPYIANPIDNMVTYLAGNDPQSLGQLALDFFGNIIPIAESGDNLPQAISRTIGSNLPQAVKPAIETIANYEFFRNREIVPKYLQNEPAYKQFTKYTPETYKYIGNLLNVSPLKVEALLEGYLAGYIKVPQNVGETLVGIANGDIDENKIPVIRRFVGNYGNSDEQELKLAKKDPEAIAKQLYEEGQRPGFFSRLFGVTNTNASDVTEASKISSDVELEFRKLEFKDSDKITENIQDRFLLYKESDGDTKSIDLFDYINKDLSGDSIASLQNIQDNKSIAKTIIKQSELFKGDGGLGTADVIKYVDQLGHNYDEVLWETIGDFNNDIEIQYINKYMDSLPAESRTEYLDVMAKNGVFTSDKLKKMVSAGMLTQSQADYLKQRSNFYTYGSSGGSTGRAKKPSFSVIKTAAPRIDVSFERKVQKPTVKPPKISLAGANKTVDVGFKIKSSVLKNPFL